jgi:transcription initiation factor TFIID subunit 1
MSFAGFLFGNINEDGELEDEGILDRSEVMQLSQLGVVGFNDIIDEELAKEDNDKSTDGTGHPTSSKEYSEDYTDINELAEDEEDDSSNRRLYMKGMTYANTSSLATTSADDDYDTEDDKMESEPPLIQSQPSTTHDEAMSTTTTTTTTITSSSQPMEAITSSTEGHAADDQHLPTDQLIKKVTELYPSFRQNSILRFSSLIKPNPSSVPSPWKHCNKRQMGTKKEPTYHQVIEISPDTVDDETRLFLTPIATQGEMRKETNSSFIDKDIREWRHGPAKVWYDMMNMPEDGRNISYDLSKMSDNVDGDQVDILQCSDELSEDAFMMVTQQQWENDIIYDMPPHSTGPPIICQGGVWTTADIKPSNSSISTPSTTTTTAAATGGGGISDDSINALPISSFPIENADLIYGKWENDIIFDSNVAGCLLKPALSRLDPNDTDLIIGIPDEPTGSSMDNELISKDGKKESKKSSKSWNKPVKSENVKFFAKKDPFNLSNDEYYNPNHISSSHGLPGIESGKVVQHSLPALDLYMPWFPTNWSMHALRYFHRPRLKIKATSNDYSAGWQTIVDLNKQIIKKDKEREKERVMSSGGEVFFMRSPVDLSSCDGYLIMAEYSEEHPPLFMACGMATKIKNYYRRPKKLKIGPPVFSLGETTFIQNTSYFLGKLKPGQWVQSFECNLFRAPIYHHVLPDTDFLVVRSDNNYYIRQVNDLFVVGQECPKVEVPAPNSKTVNQFQKDFLQVYLYRLFHESDDKPKKIKMEMVRRAFPTSVMSESVIRKVLKQFADFQREGYESGLWVFYD